MRVALDTNVLAYAEGIDDPARRKIAVSLVSDLDSANTFLPIQVLGELFRLLRKARYSAEQARTAALRWQDTFPMIETSPAVPRAALDLAVDHRLSISDAIILSCSAETGCRLLLSEDLQDGFTWNGVTVANSSCSQET